MKAITSDAFDRRLLQWMSLGGAPVVLACCARLVNDVAADAGQQVIGTLCACGLAMAMVVIGIVAGPRETRVVSAG